MYHPTCRRVRCSISLILAGVVAVACAGGCRAERGAGDVSMVRLPGESFAGVLPPLTAQERAVRDNLKAHVEKLASEIGDRNVWRHDALRRAAEYIEANLKAGGYAVASQEYEAGGKPVRNLQAELRGGEKPDEVLVVGAHYDSVRGCPAANDNGSGVAALLEIARLLKAENSARTVRFVAFVNEEPPFFLGPQMGSVVYAERCKERREKIVGMLSLETIGFYSDAKGSQNYPPPIDQMFPDRGNFIAFVGNEDSRTFTTDVLNSFRRHAKFPSEGAAAPEEVPGVGWSDHWSFWQEGYPAAMVTDTAPFRYPHYHEPTDTPDKLDYDRTARVTVGLARVIAELSGATTSQPAGGRP